MRFTRRRSDRTDKARNRLVSSPEVLEGRALLTQASLSIFSQYAPNDLAIFNPQNHQPIHNSVFEKLRTNTNPNNSLFSNQGKVVTGTDRFGDQYTITVHGPGYVIVTDITPNDGSLDDNIDTIQLVGTDINKTFVTGTVIASPYVQVDNKLNTNTQSDSTVLFNQLVATSGVNSIVLNGFTLTQTVTTPDGGLNNATTRIALLGGVRDLEFNAIQASIDTSAGDLPIDVIIGDPTTPLAVQPTIKFNSVANTVFDSTATTPPGNTVAQLAPTVNIIVNGQLKGLDFISSTQSPTIPNWREFQFPIVATTGRTAVRATGIGNLTVHGAATNFTVSRSSTPFGSTDQNGFNGLATLGHATFQGPTDGVGLDVTNGDINSLTYKKGVGNSNGLFVGTNAAGMPLPATTYGLPIDQNGFAAEGLIAGQVSALNINRLNVGPSNYNLLTPTNPKFVQLVQQGWPTYTKVNGNAVTNAAIVASGNIGHTSITGNIVNSEIKSGFHYPSFAAGLEGTRAKSQIGRIHVVGDSTNGVTSATYRPFMKIYGTPVDVYGPGKITGNTKGHLYYTGATTALGNVGTGYRALVKKGGYLPPPQAGVPQPK